MTSDALQRAIIDDFNMRAKRLGKETSVTTIKEVSPYAMMTEEELAERCEADEEYAEYVETWDGPEGDTARYTFMLGIHDAESITMPPSEFLARYSVRSWDDFWSFDSEEYGQHSSTVH